MQEVATGAIEMTAAPQDQFREGAMPHVRVSSVRREHRGLGLKVRVGYAGA